MKLLASNLRITTLSRITYVIFRFFPNIKKYLISVIFVKCITAYI